MTKEQLLFLLKDSIVMLKNKGIEMKTKPEMYKAWKQQWDRITNDLHKLTLEDHRWVSEEYSKWFQETFKEDLKKVHS